MRLSYHPPTSLKSPWLGILPALVAASCALLCVPSSAHADETFGVESFETTVSAGGQPATQAGSHPDALTTKFLLKRHPQKVFSVEQLFPDGGDPRDIEVNLPAGLAVNPRATPVRCTEAALEAEGNCPDASALGVVEVKSSVFPELRAAIFNMVPPPGVPAEFGFNAAGVGLVAHIAGNVRTGGDYGLTADVTNISQKVAIYGADVTLWGSPSDSSHDRERGECVNHTAEQTEVEQEELKLEAESGGVQPGKYKLGICAVGRDNTPLLTLASGCGGPMTATVRADSWSAPGQWTAPTNSSPAMPAVAGCGKLNFAPTFATASEPNQEADAPAGLTVDVSLPREDGLTALSESTLREAVVRLPAGLTVSASAANGLGACTLEQIELSGAAPATCPDSSKIGTVRIATPLLEAPLEGSVYVAQQGNLAGNGTNPFGSLLALYIVAEGSGALVKLAGEVSLNAGSGQITARFGEDPLQTIATGQPQFLPDLPFSDFTMRVSGGPKAALASPRSCGTYPTVAELAPWSGSAPAQVTSSYSVGAACAPEGFRPGLVSGTATNQAGSASQLSVTLSRHDREQRPNALQLTMPPGLLGVIRSVTQCPEPAASTGTCGPDSVIGEATVAVGVGPDPYWVGGGQVFLTGPYHGAPFGLSVVVPAIAGPFNLGNVIVRARISIDPSTAQVTVASDPFPTMLQGVPVNLRTVHIQVSRPGFILNPTNCASLQTTGVVSSNDGATASVASPFEAANCSRLPFRPAFSATTISRTSKAGGASLRVRVASSPGQANIAKVKVSLPKQLPSRLTTLQRACVDAVFKSDPAHCPAESVIGTATAETPLLARPLTGPAILVSHGGAAFPDVVIVLQGEGVVLNLDGNTDIKKGVTTSTFNSVPDAPISTFTLALPRGPHSIFATNLPAKARGILCGQKLVMPTTITGQNGAMATQSTKVGVTGCPKPKKAKVGERKKHKRARPGLGKKAKTK